MHKKHRSGWLKRTVTASGLKTIALGAIVLGTVLSGAGSHETSFADLTISAAAAETSDLTMDVIDVGQGLSLLFESDGAYMLYDGGDREYSSKVVSYLKQKGIEELSYVVASHYDSDHLNGIVGAMNVFEVEHVIRPDYTTDTRVFESFTELLAENEIEQIDPQAGSQFMLGNTIVTILAPNDSGYDDINDYSVCLRLDCGETSVIVTGDATQLSELEMIAAGHELDADILVAGHHGSDTSTCEEFLNAVSPGTVVISCGEENQYLHPSQEVMELLQRQGIAVCRTDKQGDFQITTDGSGYYASVNPCNDYSYGGELPEEYEEERNQQVTYILNINTDKFHLPDCGSVKQMKEKNKRESYDSRDVVMEQGFDPCGNCHP